MLLGRRGTPPVIARIVPRPRLTRLLSSASQLVVLAAPAGYGKTTLLSEWAVHDERPFAWVTLEPADNDPACLEASVALAVERVEPERRTGRLVLVLDDLQALYVAGRARRARRRSSTASRPRSRWRSRRAHVRRCRSRVCGRRGGSPSSGRPTSPWTPGRPPRCCGSPDSNPAPTTPRELWSRTEGWPAAARARRAVPRRSLGARSGRGLRWRRPAGRRLRARRGPCAGSGPQDRRLLLETAVLDTLSGPSCDHVLDRTGSAAALVGPRPRAWRR